MSDLLQSLEGIINLATYHREHEKYYARAPLYQALSLQQASAVFTTLADRWSVMQAVAPKQGDPFIGCEDLNELMTIQYCGVLFLEGEGEPPEIVGFKRKLREDVDTMGHMGQWLENAMRSAWQTAQSLSQVPELTGVLGERHRIILNDWQAANNASLVAALLRRALKILERIDFTPLAIRADLVGPRVFSEYLYAASELINRAADLASESAALTHDNERRWRMYKQRVQQVHERLAAIGTRESQKNKTSLKHARRKQRIDIPTKRRKDERMKILKIFSRIYLPVEQLENTVAFYERLLDERCSRRFQHPHAHLELASIGSILLIAGSEDALAPFKTTLATFFVDSLDAFREALLQEGATILYGPELLSTGMNMGVRHPDGTSIEYVQPIQGQGKTGGKN